MSCVFMNKKAQKKVKKADEVKKSKVKKVTFNTLLAFFYFLLYCFQRKLLLFMFALFIGIALGKYKLQSATMISNWNLFWVLYTPFFVYFFSIQIKLKEINKEKSKKLSQWRCGSEAKSTKKILWKFYQR